ncbi:hypothetical protein [Ktedonospora formicarum]|uniref:Uncharacterized protein n=1 Tax=Ktedonospora formicarum TaxID=2778364 RepID=A0A8J3I237_9CHLR|nr:hypothetical protein [Ktedonospora formicarum]GHO47361.1 hypothetical protein KSX_55240 [Ktedonospora formicarum]
MEQQQDEQKSRELSSQLVSIMTTEHYNLQTGRAMTISEANGRASLFVGSVSSGLVALALVAQLSQLSIAFFAFSLIVLPTLFFMGLLTFQRILQSGMADLVYSRGINRIRHLYLEHAPEMQPYFILGSHDDGEIISQESMLPNWLQSFFTMASMVSIITSVLAGSFFGILFILFALPLWTCIVAGGIGFLISIVLLQTYQQGQWVRLEKSIPVNFPRQPKQ